VTGPAPFVIRPAEPDEYDALGDLVVAAYRALEGGVVEAGYEAELRAVGRRAVEAVVLAAVAPAPGGGPDFGDVSSRNPVADVSKVRADRLLGCVTYVPGPVSPWAEEVEPGEAAIRMLAVAPDQQGRGVGEALTVACIERARAAGRTAIVLHSTPWMTAAHRLYGRLGFRRLPERDWQPAPSVPLLAFTLPL
jgi:ribosomal protein S18 acetylase RimI-like enzyme